MSRLAERQQPAELGDAVLVERFRNGDAAAFDTLVRKYQRQIFHLALRYVRNDADAQDVAQRAMVLAFQRLASLRKESSFRTWVYRITVNLALNVLRDRGRGQQIQAEDQVADGEPLIEAESRRRLRAAVAELPAKQRLVVELRIFEELPFAEVAQIAECSEDSAKMNYHHALVRLREIMREGEGHGPPG